MSAPGVEVDPPCGCRADLGEVCPRCDLRQQANAQIDAMSRDLGLPVPTALVPRPTPGSVAAELTALRAEHRREVLDLHGALDAAGAPLGGSPVERIEALATRKPSPQLPHILALLDMRAKGDEALTHLVALLRGAL